MKKLYHLLLALGVALLLDAVTKFWAEQTLAPYQPAPVIGDYFRFTLGYNTGVAFGLFANGGVWPLVITGVVILFLLFWFAQLLWRNHFSGGAAWPIGLLLGGAIGNFADRLVDGRVTDFLDVGMGATRWPTFNLADSFILVSVALLTLFSFDHSPDDSHYKEATPEGEVEILT